MQNATPAKHEGPLYAFFWFRFRLVCCYHFRPYFNQIDALQNLHSSNQANCHFLALLADACLSDAPEEIIPLHQF